MTAAHGAPLLAVEQLRVWHGERPILRGLDFTLAGSGCCVLLGPAGAGKSTLLRVLAGYATASAATRIDGQLQYAGHPLRQAPGTSPDVTARPALMAQRSSLLVSSLLDNLVCEWPQRSHLSRAKQIAYLRPWLAQYQHEFLVDLFNTQVVSLPLPLQRRIALLRILLSEPPLLLLDEPTFGLRADEAEPLLALINQIKAQQALLVVTHHQQHARAIADRVLLLAGGRLREDSPAARFFSAPESECGRQFLLTGSCPDVADDVAEAPSDAAPLAATTPATEETIESAIERTTETATSSATNATPPSNATPPPIAPTSAQALAPGPVPATPSPYSVSALPTSKLQALINSGRTTAGAHGGPRGFTWLLPGQLAGTPWPGIVHGADYDLALLRAVGVSHLLSLTEAPFPPETAHPFGLRVATSPIVDMAAPSLAQAQALCQWIDTQLKAQACVAVHCRAGLGRTGTVLGCYWLWLGRGQRTAVETLEHLRRQEPGWVQSDVQVDFLSQFAAALHRGAAALSRRNATTKASDTAQPTVTSIPTNTASGVPQ